MTPRQIAKLARDTIKAGPVITHDKNGNGYLAYVIFVRVGFKYDLIICDRDIAELNGNTLEFFRNEIEYAIEELQSRPLSSTSVDAILDLRPQ